MEQESSSHFPIHTKAIKIADLVTLTNLKDSLVPDSSQFDLTFCRLPNVTHENLL
jgi:hypothetical protein